jgi:hypothetical protein
MKRANLIPKAIAYAKDCHTIENWSFQKWLQDTIDREDLIAWAQRDDIVRVVGVVPPSRMYESDKKETRFFRRFLSPILP